LKENSTGKRGNPNRLIRLPLILSGARNGFRLAAHLLLHRECGLAVDQSSRSEQKDRDESGHENGEPGETMGTATGQGTVIRGGQVTEDAIGARRLWTAVIVKAVEDWRSGNLRDRRAAQTFLFEGEDDFNEVCAGAGLDPGSFRGNLLRIGRRVEMHGPWMQAPATQFRTRVGGEPKTTGFLVPSFVHSVHS
jgi:hypothetical protein